MHIDLVREAAHEVPNFADPSSIGSLRIWFCRYETLGPLTTLRQLKTLVIAGVPDENLGFVAELEGLEYLRILHLPRVVDLTPLAELHRLQTLSRRNLSSTPA